MPFLVPVDKNNSQDQIWDRQRLHKIANSEETAFVTSLFSNFLMIGRTNFTICEHFERFHRSKLQSKIIISEHLPSWSLSFTTKIILIIFTIANDSPNLSHRLLMAFSDLEKQNHKTFLQKQYDGVRANIEQKPHRVSLSAILQFYRIIYH